MKNKDQKILKFNFDQNLKEDDYYVSNSNIYAYELLNKWPKWEKNFLNIIGESFSGKSHLVDIFLKKFKGIKIEAQDLNNEILKKIKVHQNIVLENFNSNIDENLAYTLFNIAEQDNKYLILTSNKPVVDIKFRLDDLNSRCKNFLLSSINKPDDELIFALIIKNLSDKQISLDNKLINYIVKRIDRSYGKIFDFIYKIDEMSLKKKKSIDLKIIKEVLGE